ncbi:MAG: 3-phosphoshikimate 1-carboxyvinyltransferase [Chitinophagaceae bacterium]
MKVTILPSMLKGSILAPTSKSSMQRALAASLLRKGITHILNPGFSNDDKAALDTIQKLGAVVQVSSDKITVESHGVDPENDTIHCGESGLGIRMFTPIAAMSQKKLTVTGSGSLTVRPMDFFDEIFPKLGISIQSNNGKLPLIIQGPLKPASIEVDGSLSSQFLTGLLMAFAASGAEKVVITVKDLKSKPYIDLTLKVLKDFGWVVKHNDYKTFSFEKDSAFSNIERTYQVEGDWSGAAFLLVAGAIAGDIVVKGLDIHSTQADRAVLQALMSSGAVMSVEEEQITISKGALKAFHFNATECPDLFPPLVALASFCEGKTVIEGTTRLTHKESNRAVTLQEEFGKLGIVIELQDDIMIIHGSEKVKSTNVHSRHDHRIAMACAVAALRAEGPVTIEEAEAINKSYPEFYEHIKSLGALIKE